MVPPLSLSLLALLALPSAASAQSLEYAAPTASISRGAPLTFAVRTSAPAGSVVVRVSGGEEVGADGLLTGPEGTWLDEEDVARLIHLSLTASGGPITKDNTGAETYATVFAIAESPIEKGLIWVGTNDGLVQSFDVERETGVDLWGYVADGFGELWRSVNFTLDRFSVRPGVCRA